jgi:hypothetical protein
MVYPCDSQSVNKKVLRKKNKVQKKVRKQKTPRMWGLMKSENKNLKV